MTIRRGLLIVLLLGATLGFGAAPAGADVVSPPGACAGAGAWTKAKFTERLKTKSPDDVITIPRTDVVKWRGNLKGQTPKSKVPRRDIEGELVIVLPAGQHIVVNHWDKTSIKGANRGRRGYNLPVFFSGVKMKLEGHHEENGKTVCSGSIWLKVDGGAGSNPLTWAAVAGIVLSGLALLWAGRAVTRGDSTGSTGSTGEVAA